MMPVAVTGMGVVSAAGIGVSPLWNAVRDGRSAITLLTDDGFARNHVRLAARAPFEAEQHLPSQELRLMDRFTAMAMVAAAEAMQQSALDPASSAHRVAVIIGTGIGGATTSDAASAVFYTGVGRGDPMSIPKIMPNAAASQIAMRYGIHGPVMAVSSHRRRPSALACN